MNFTVNQEEMNARKKLEKICVANPEMLDHPVMKEIERQWQRDLNKLIGEKTEGFDAWMEKWMKLWPLPKETNLDYVVSGNTATCQRKMRSFIKRFFKMFPHADKKEWTQDKIRDAIYRSTAVYLEDRKTHDWAMTMKNSNFIQHSEKGSLLETYINLFLEGKLEKHEKRLLKHKNVRI